MGYRVFCFHPGPRAKALVILIWKWVLNREQMPNFASPGLCQLGCVAGFSCPLAVLGPPTTLPREARSAP